jgi:quercetin dioxygenase-like cupin family protein
MPAFRLSPFCSPARAINLRLFRRAGPARHLKAEWFRTVHLYQGMRAMTLSTMPATAKPKYTVKNCELLVAGANVQARLFTLAPGESIPWHYHSEITDHYFVLRGALTIVTRCPASECVFEIGDRHHLDPGMAHFLANRGATDCQFLLLQGVGKYDWIKADG